LREVKDIQDELHILSVLLENQLLVLKQASDAMDKTTDPQDAIPGSPRLSLSPAVRAVDGKVGQPAPYSSENHFSKLYDIVLEQEKRRKGLQAQAELANKAVNHPLTN